MEVRDNMQNQSIAFALRSPLLARWFSRRPTHGWRRTWSSSCGYRKLFVATVFVCVCITITSESVFSLAVGMIVLAINASVAWCLVGTVFGGRKHVVQEDTSSGCRSAPGQTLDRVRLSSPARNAECRARIHCLCSSCMHRARLDP